MIEWLMHTPLVQPKIAVREHLWTWFAVCDPEISSNHPLIVASVQALRLLGLSDAGIQQKAPRFYQVYESMRLKGVLEEHVRYPDIPNPNKPKVI